jgi:GT2 family glycosyltransferase
VYERVGGFDPNIFMYVEETDWCYRIRSHGFSVVYWPDAAIIHYGGQSAVRGRKDQIINIFKGYQYFYTKHFDAGRVRRLHFLLRFKCYLLIALGRILRNNYLVSTYSEALTVIT